jgi:hypothetical protein
MNTATLANLFVVCSAHVLEPCAPLSITVTYQGKRLTRRIRAAERILADLPAAWQIAPRCPSLCCSNELLPDQTVCPDCAAFADDDC